MTRKLLLEISVDGVEKAVAAERGGANRIELCADLSVGGLTPSRELLLAVREKVYVPIYSMIRPRAGDFAYSEAEFAGMERSIAVATECGMDGVVLGILKENRRIDMARTRRLVDLARPLPVTFHRAFDECPDLRKALEAVIQAAAARILSSGGAKTALQGAAKLAELIAAARDHISGVWSPVDRNIEDSRRVSLGFVSRSSTAVRKTKIIGPDEREQPVVVNPIILPGAGITHSNIAEVARATGAIEFHAGLGSVLPYPTSDYAAFASEVRQLAEELARLS